MAVQGWNLVYIRATPHHTGLIPSRWTQLQQDVQPFVGTNLIPYRYVTTYTSPCNMKDPIKATCTTSTLSLPSCTTRPRKSQHGSGLNIGPIHLKGNL